MTTGVIVQGRTRLRQIHNFTDLLTTLIHFGFHLFRVPQYISLFATVRVHAIFHLLLRRYGAKMLIIDISESASATSTELRNNNLVQSSFKNARRGNAAVH